MSSQNRIGLILTLVVLVSAAAVLFSRDTKASDDSRTGDVSVSCGPSQRAVVQQAGAGASPRIHVVCVDVAEEQPAAWTAQPSPQPFVPAGLAGAPVMVPAVAYAPMVQSVQSAPVANPQVVAAPVRRAAPGKPSVQRRLLVIGGTTGAGAGIGALVGGKKGALVGAAIGAGGATIVDQVKHR